MGEIAAFRTRDGGLTPHFCLLFSEKNSSIFIKLTIPLVVHPALQVVSLLSVEAGTARMLAQVQCSASGIDVLLPLLESYPHYCPYEVLVSHLFPLLTVEHCRKMILEAEGAEREVLLTPLRRAIGSLSPGLHLLGLEACSLRNIGYMLKKYTSRSVPSPR